MLVGFYFSHGNATRRGTYEVTAKTKIKSILFICHGDWSDSIRLIAWLIYFCTWFATHAPPPFATWLALRSSCRLHVASSDAWGAGNYVDLCTVRLHRLIDRSSFVLRNRIERFSNVDNENLQCKERKLIWWSLAAARWSTTDHYLWIFYYFFFLNIRAIVTRPLLCGDQGVH